MLELRNKRIGIVLSGGGAKGAYQIGMLRALEEKSGLDKSGLCLAGTSIGAMNSLLYAISDTDRMRSLLMNYSKAPDPNVDIKGSLAQTMREYYPDELIIKNKVPVSVCVFSLNKKMPLYFRLNDLPCEDQRKLTLASGSLPGIWPAVEYKGDKFTDGGWLPEDWEYNKPFDKVPVITMKDEKLDILLISYLDPEYTVDHSFIDKDVRIIISRPSVFLENSPGTGTLDFSHERLAENERLGYEETCRLIDSL